MGEVDQGLLRLGSSIGRGWIKVAGALAGMSVEEAKVVANLVADKVAIVGCVPVAGVG
jgi:hypothetical protein